MCLNCSLLYIYSGCPDTLVSTLSRSVLSAVKNIDITEFKEDEPDSKEEGHDEADSDIIAEDKQISK